ncbi:MAG: L-threonylcarbamoyladenylate synthase, partial [Planctomycetota bacterium]
MKTEVFKVNPASFEPEELARPAKILAAGGLVAFPTETVYGIAVNMHRPEAVHKLLTLKNRPKDKPFSIHVAQRDEVAKFVKEVSPVARSLMNLYWPGPLTIVFPGNAGVAVGIRFPSHPLATALIDQSGVPVGAPSANLVGMRPAIDAEGVLATFDGKIEAVLDGGRTEIRQASTVVRIQGKDFQVAREGLITERMIRRALRGKSILFVCTGNSCRSPMAVALCKQTLAELLGMAPEELAERGYRIASAGIAAFDGGKASENATVVMAEQGLDISDHRSRRVTQDMVEEADLIIALSPSHHWQLVEWNPAVAEKVQVIADIGITDPIGGSQD